jgi:hypothetical protein
MSRVLLFSLTAALYPTLLAATTIMLLLPHPQRLLLGYLLGALTTSVTLGLVIVLALDGESPATSAAKHTINPVWDIVLGGSSSSSPSSSRGGATPGYGNAPPAGAPPARTRGRPGGSGRSAAGAPARPSSSARS